MSKLYAVSDDEQEPTQQEIELAYISQNWREWRGADDLPKHGWVPIDTSATNLLNVDAVLRRGERQLPGVREAWWRRVCTPSIQDGLNSKSVCRA